MKELIRNSIQKVLLTVDQDDKPIPEFSIDYPKFAEFGDFSTNVALLLAKKQQKPVSEVADVLISALKADSHMSQNFEKIEFKNGFVNFWYKSDILVNISRAITSLDKSVVNKNKKIIVEFTDPNPFKEFHIGHLYTNIVGESICRILEVSGAVVKRANYQGDVGVHVAKAIWGLQKIGGDTEKMSEAYALGNRMYEEDQGAKEEINQLNKKIYEHAPEVEEIYQKGKQWSLDNFEKIYARLGTKFDFYFFESQVSELGTKIVKENLKKGIFKESKGAVIFPGSEHGLHDRVFLNSLGLPTYEAKELALAPTKYENFSYDESIIITANEISEYFKVLLTAMTLIFPDLASKTKHIGHGMVKLPEGKMSSRTGNIIRAEELLNQVKLKAAEINEKVAEEVALAAVKYSFLKVGIGHDIIFEINDSLSLEGNSGPYLQYTYARAHSILEKGTNVSDTVVVSKLQLEKEERELLVNLSRFGDVISMSAKMYSPSYLCEYLFSLAQSFNSFYNKHKIITSDKEEFRLQLTQSTADVLKTGMGVLGITVLEKM